jgi:hypothetical protein
LECPHKKFSYDNIRDGLVLDTRLTIGKSKRPWWLRFLEIHPQ